MWMRQKQRKQMKMKDINGSHIAEKEGGRLRRRKRSDEEENLRVGRCT